MSVYNSGWGLWTLGLCKQSARPHIGPRLWSRVASETSITRWRSQTYNQHLQANQVGAGGAWCS